MENDSNHDASHDIEENLDGPSRENLELAVGILSEMLELHMQLVGLQGELIDELRKAKHLQGALVDELTEKIHNWEYFRYMADDWFYSLEADNMDFEQYTEMLL